MTTTMQQDNQIAISFNEDELAEHLYISDEYDCVPGDLTVHIDKAHFAMAREIFKQYPEIFSLNFSCGIDSDSFDGKLRGDQITIYPWSAYACFVNDWTQTSYEICLDDKLRKLNIVEYFAESTVFEQNDLENDSEVRP